MRLELRGGGTPRLLSQDQFDDLRMICSHHDPLHINFNAQLSDSEHAHYSIWRSRKKDC